MAQELPPVSPGEVIEAGTFGNPVLARLVDRGTRAAQGAAGAAVDGDLWFVTDENVLDVYYGGSWESLAPTKSVGANRADYSAGRVTAQGVGSRVLVSQGTIIATFPAPKDYQTGQFGQSLHVSFGVQYAGGGTNNQVFSVTADIEGGGMSRTVHTAQPDDIGEGVDAPFRTGMAMFENIPSLNAGQTINIRADRITGGSTAYMLCSYQLIEDWFEQ